MIRPASFGANEETAATNFFQSDDKKTDARSTHEAALGEFDNMVALLKSHDINVLVVDDTPTPVKPSAAASRMSGERTPTENGD